MEVSENKEDATIEKENKQHIKTVELGTLDLFKHPGCRNATLILFVVWTSVTLGKCCFVGAYNAECTMISYLARLLMSNVTFKAIFVIRILWDQYEHDRIE